MKRKKNTYYSKVVLKESPYKKKQRQLNNYERLSDERNYMRARYNSMYNKHNSKKTAKSLKWGEIPISYNCYISWEEFWNAWEVHKRKHNDTKPRTTHTKTAQSFSYHV